MEKDVINLEESKERSLKVEKGRKNSRKNHAIKQDKKESQ